MIHLVTAVVKPFKLEEIKDALGQARRREACVVQEVRREEARRSQDGELDEEEGRHRVIPVVPAW